MKEDSKPPMCGLHSMSLVQHKSSEYSTILSLGVFTFWMYPVSGYVVREKTTAKQETTGSLFVRDMSKGLGAGAASRDEFWQEGQD